MTPMMPVAPLRLSITIDQPRCALIHWAMIRGMPSYGPPAGEGTMMRIGFPGYGSALQARVRSPARNAGATRSLAAQRRFKRTDEAPRGDLLSSIRPALVPRYDDGRRQPSRYASRRLDQCGGL